MLKLRYFQYDCLPILSNPRVDTQTFILMNVKFSQIEVKNPLCLRRQRSGTIRNAAGEREALRKKVPSFVSG